MSPFPQILNTCLVPMSGSKFPATVEMCHFGTIYLQRCVCLQRSLKINQFRDGRTGDTTPNTLPCQLPVVLLFQWLPQVMLAAVMTLCTLNSPLDGSLYSQLSQVHNPHVVYSDAEKSLKFWQILTLLFCLLWRIGLGFYFGVFDK